MTTFRLHTDDDGGHYAFSHGQTHGDPFPTVAAAARFIAALNGTQRLMVLVSRSGYTKSPWDSYAKMFVELDGKSAAERLLEWWHSLADDAYTKTRAVVQVFDVTARKSAMLSSDPRALHEPEPAGPLLELRFAASDIRERARLAGAGEDLAAVSDGAIADAALAVVARDERLWALVPDLDRDIIAAARALERHRTAAGAP
jgi:hypothetical protein